MPSWNTTLASGTRSVRTGSRPSTGYCRARPSKISTASKRRQATREQIVRAHRESLFRLYRARPAEAGAYPARRRRYRHVAEELEAALRSAGAGIQAVDEVMQGLAGNAFCLVRPPGHHAEAVRPAASACSTMPPSPLFMRRPPMAPSAWPLWISTFITAMERSRYSGHGPTASMPRPIRCRCFRAAAASPSGARTAISSTRR